MRSIAQGCALACGLALVVVGCSRKSEPSAAAPTQTSAPAAAAAPAGNAAPPQTQPPEQAQAEEPAASEWVGPRCLTRFKAFDADSDGRVSKAEFAAQTHPHGDADEIFAARDANGDGFLTESEFCSGAGRGMGPGMRGPGRGRGMGPGMRGPGAGRGMVPGSTAPAPPAHSQ